MRIGIRLSGLTALLLAAAPLPAADIEKFLPKETDIVVTLNVRQLLESEVMKKYALDFVKDQLGKNQEAGKMLEAINLDPLKDVERLTLGAGGDDPQDMKFVAVIEGNFDVEKLNAAGAEAAKKKSDSVAVEKADGKTFFRITQPNQPNPAYLAVVNKKTIVAASTKEYLVSSFAAAEGSKKSEVRKEVAELMGKADSKSSMTVVAGLKGKLKNIPLPDPNIAKLLEALESATMDLRIEKDMKLELAFNTEDDDSAKALNELMTQGLAQAKQFVPLIAIQNPQLKPLGDMVNNLKNIAKGKSVKLNAELTSEAIEEMAKSAKDK